MTQSEMKKFILFFAIFLSIIGGIGSFGYLVWQKEWVIAAGVLVVCFAASPTIKNWVNKLINE